MTEQDRIRILYDLTLRDIDHSNRRRVHVVRYYVPIPALVFVLAVLVKGFDLSASQSAALLVATVPTSVLAYVGWTNAHDDRMEALTLRATDLRLQITDDTPIAVERSEAAREIEDSIARARTRTALVAGPVDAET